MAEYAIIHRKINFDTENLAKKSHYFEESMCGKVTILR